MLCTVYAQFTSENGLKYVGVFLEEKQGKDYFKGGTIIMDYGLVFWPEVMV